jgi:transposase
MVKRAKYGEAQKFIEYAVASDTDECIIWPFCTDAKGYGVLGWGRAHRVVCEKSYGSPPKPNYLACHMPLICHSRRCINPRHLYWGTNVQNGLDSRTERTCMQVNLRVLSEEQVISVALSTKSIRVLAAEYGVAQGTIQKIKSGRNMYTLDIPIVKGNPSPNRLSVELKQQIIEAIGNNNQIAKRFGVGFNTVKRLREGSDDV